MREERKGERESVRKTARMSEGMIVW